MNGSMNEVLPTVETRREHNACGECQACCCLYPIDELDKPLMALCRHQCETGCAIHGQERPPVCIAFRCAWLDEDWAPELRPDRCRIIWTYRGCLPDRGGRPRRVWLGEMFDRHAYLRRANARWRDRLVSRNEIVFFSHPVHDLDEGMFTISCFSKMAFPGLEPRHIYRHICADLDFNAALAARQNH